MNEYRRLTPQTALEFADKARNDGYPELAIIFESVATKIAKFNEHNSTTIEQVRQELGEEKFWQLWKELE